MSHSKRAAAYPAPPFDVDFGEQQNFLEQLADLNQLLTRVCSLDHNDAKTVRLYEKMESAAEKYRNEDIKAKIYVCEVKRFANKVIMAFEGLQSGRCTQEKAVFQDFAKRLKESRQDLLMPLKDVTATIENMADGVFDLAKESGLLASEYEQAGRRYEVVGHAATAAVLGVGLLEFYLNYNYLGISNDYVLTKGCARLSQPVVSWSKDKQYEMKQKGEMLKSLNQELSEIASIIQKQVLLLKKAYDIIGPYMSKMHNRAEERLASGKPTTLAVDKIIKDAKELEALCLSFQKDH